MNKIIDALKLAETTLRDIIRVYKFETGTPVTALAAIREALADHIANAGKVIAEPVQEPVVHYKKALDAWFEKTEWVQETAKPKELGMHRADVLKQRIHELEKQLATPVSAKREWVDLTEHEIEEIENREFSQNDWLWFYTRAVIAAFKDKNK